MRNGRKIANHARMNIRLTEMQNSGQKIIKIYTLYLTNSVRL